MTDDAAPDEQGNRLFANDVEEGWRYGVVFEGNDQVGWLYFLVADPPSDHRIVHATEVYRGPPRFDAKACTILWSPDRARAGLRIGAHVWAVYDFRDGRSAAALYDEHAQPSLPGDLIAGLG